MPGPTILNEIFAHKRREVARDKRRLPLAEVRAAAEAAPVRLDFIARLQNARRPALIAEIKRASPSRGVLAPTLDPVELAGIYVHNGATAVSVLTDKRYFQGRLEFLRQVAGAFPDIPLLRKDFICDPYQVYQARAAGASAVLLIAAGLEQSLLQDLHSLAGELSMAALVEVHDQAELETALACRPALVGINNRDLHDFHVDLRTTVTLRPLVPPEVCVVAESGIHNLEDAARMAAAGVHAILVGESLVTAGDIAGQVQALAAVGRLSPAPAAREH